MDDWSRCLLRTPDQVAEFREVHVTTASCTIASHCGPNTLGILFETQQG